MLPITASATRPASRRCVLEIRRRSANGSAAHRRLGAATEEMHVGHRARAPRRHCPWPRHGASTATVRPRSRSKSMVLAACWRLPVAQTRQSPPWPVVPGRLRRCADAALAGRQLSTGAGRMASAASCAGRPNGTGCVAPAAPASRAARSSTSNGWRGPYVAVLGAGAWPWTMPPWRSSTGADVHLFCRRAEPSVVQRYRWLTFAGFLKHIGRDCRTSGAGG